MTETHKCQCPAPGMCPVFNRKMGGRIYDICRGTVRGMSAEKRAAYLRTWAKNPQLTVPASPAPEATTRPQQSEPRTPCKPCQQQAATPGGLPVVLNATIQGKHDYAVILRYVATAGFWRGVPVANELPTGCKLVFGVSTENPDKLAGMLLDYNDDVLVAWDALLTPKHAGYQSERLAYFAGCPSELPEACRLPPLGFYVDLKVSVNQ